MIEAIKVINFKIANKVILMILKVKLQNSKSMTIKLVETNHYRETQRYLLHLIKMMNLMKKNIN
jgi:hypothetical protein